MGEWNRSDGDYKLVIEEEEGSLKAAYLNPNPIKVEATTVAEVDGTLQVTIVLRDQGYPGSTYVLEYMPDYRVLAGTYTIPGQAPSEVYFTK